MTTPYRQPIYPGNVGTDVTAVKRALVEMGIHGAGGLIVTGSAARVAGQSFVAVLRTAQSLHRLTADGKYGPATHAFVAPHFDAYGVQLYREAPIRVNPVPPAPGGSAAAFAKKLLAYDKSGKYRADNGGDLRDIQATSEGKAVWSQGGKYVHLDERILEVVCWLIEHGHAEVGTFALCSDHSFDGWHGHAGGLAVDVSSVQGLGVVSSAARAVTLAAAKALHSSVPAHLKPRQLICGGYGGVRDSEISACTIPSAGYYGTTTMSEHCNHIHVGY